MSLLLKKKNERFLKTGAKVRIVTIFCNKAAKFYFDLQQILPAPMKNYLCADKEG